LDIKPFPHWPPIPKSAFNDVRNHGDSMSTRHQLFRDRVFGMFMISVKTAADSVARSLSFERFSCASAGMQKLQQ
jgi:hypothetical protein